MKELPDVSDLLVEEKYWTEEIFFRFTERCNEVTFENPRHGLEVSRHAPELARKVAPRATQPALIHMTALAVLGSGYRAVGNCRESEKSYAAALVYARELSELETAELKLRIAYLRREQRRFKAAFELINEAIRTYRRDGDLTRPHFLGCCYLARGLIHWEDGSAGHAILDLSRALNHIDIEFDSKVYYSAMHNLAVALADCPDPRALGEVEKLLKQAQRRIPYRGRHLSKFKIKWLKGLIHLRFGLTRQGERLLQAARKGFIELGAAHEVAVVSLDLALLHLDEGREPWEIEAFAVETYRLCRDLSADEEALAALAIWRHAAAQGELTSEVVQAARKTIAQLMK